MGSSKTDNVVQLKRTHTEMRWVCNCGSSHFGLRPSGEIVCIDCEAVQTVRHFDPREKP